MPIPAMCVASSGVFRAHEASPLSRLDLDAKLCISSCDYTILAMIPTRPHKKGPRMSTDNPANGAMCDGDRIRLTTLTDKGG